MKLAEILSEIVPGPSAFVSAHGCNLKQPFAYSNPVFDSFPRPPKSLAICCLLTTVNIGGLQCIAERRKEYISSMPRSMVRDKCYR